MQAGEHKLHHRHLLERVQPHRNAAAVVAHRKRAVIVNAYADFIGKAAECFIGGIVNHFLADVGGALGAGIHARALFYRLEAF